MAKHVLCCMKGTIGNKLTFRKSKSGIKLFGYCDADWGHLLTARASYDMFSSYQQMVLPSLGKAGNNQA